jgi:hypothetical protein
MAPLSLGLIPGAEALDFASTFSNNPPEECKKEYLAWFFMFITVTTIVMYLWKAYKWWDMVKGYKLKGLTEVYMFFELNHRFVPIKLTSFKGHLPYFDISQNSLKEDKAILLTKNCLWDNLSVNWESYGIMYQGRTIKIPADITIPLLHKIRLRNIMSGNDWKCYFMLSQNHQWYDPNKNSYPPVFSIRQDDNNQQFPSHQTQTDDDDYGDPADDQENQIPLTQRTPMERKRSLRFSDEVFEHAATPY